MNQMNTTTTTETTPTWSAHVQLAGKPRTELGVFASHRCAQLMAERFAAHYAKCYGEDQVEYFGARRIAPSA